jgi:trk system potassium uptake protein TrkH
MPRVRTRALSPAQLLSLHIAGLITAGGLLLSLPIAAAPGTSVPVLDAFFTSTSAVCVTGLIVRDTPVDYSLFGQIVIMLLIQAGGLGYMTISTVLTLALRRRTTMQERLTLADALNVSSMEGLLRFAATVAALTLAFELTGALIMAVRFSFDVGWAKGLYFGVFHAVSAFNNAGFALFSDNLMRYRGDVTINAVITGLIICGGLGFLVLAEALGLQKVANRPGLSTHARMALAITAGLLVIGTLSILGLEWANAKTLGPLPFGEKLLASWFQSVTARTAGFNTIDNGALTAPAAFITIVLMFIGASPGSTGGGVKTTTFGIALAAVVTTVRGGSDIVVFRRRLSRDTVSRAFAVIVIAFVGVAAVSLALLVVERQEFLHTVFETTSAFGTVGLSMSLPGTVVSLSGFFGAAGKVLIMSMMFMGRVGPLTLAIALAGRGAPPRITYPEGKVMIG